MAFHRIPDSFEFQRHFHSGSWHSLPVLLRLSRAKTIGFFEDCKSFLGKNWGVFHSKKQNWCLVSSLNSISHIKMEQELHHSKIHFEEATFLLQGHPYRHWRDLTQQGCSFCPEQHPAAPRPCCDSALSSHLLLFSFLSTQRAAVRKWRLFLPSREWFSVCFLVGGGGCFFSPICCAIEMHGRSAE